MHKHMNMHMHTYTRARAGVHTHTHARAHTTRPPPPTTTTCASVLSSRLPVHPPTDLRVLTPSSSTVTCLVSLAIALPPATLGSAQPTHSFTHLLTLSPFIIFVQPMYYRMPTPPTSPRVESPATLGRKCWAFAYVASPHHRHHVYTRTHNITATTTTVTSTTTTSTTDSTASTTAVARR
jgi:hypothetical protein